MGYGVHPLMGHPHTDHRPDSGPPRSVRGLLHVLHRVDRVRAPENAETELIIQANRPNSAESRMMNWMLPTFASLVLHSHWDRRAVIRMVCLQRRL